MSSTTTTPSTETQVAVSQSYRTFSFTRSPTAAYTNRSFVTQTVTYEGDFLKQFVTDFESRIRSDYGDLLRLIDEKNYDLARYTKKKIQERWELLFRQHDKQRMMREEYEGRAFGPGAFSIWTVRCMMYKYLLDTIENLDFNSELRSAFHTYCFDDVYVFLEVEKLDDDDWLKDLWEDCGCIALRKVRIPTK